MRPALPPVFTACPPRARPGPPWLRTGLAAALACLTLVAAGPARSADTSAIARDIEQQYRRGETAQALQRLNAAVAAQPGDAAMRFLQGVLLAEGGQAAEAAVAFERLTQEFPDLPEPHNNLAVLQAAGGRLDAARASLETALQLDPQYRAAHENLGDVYVRLALRAYSSAADATRPDPVLQRKLQFARDLVRNLPRDGGQAR